MMSDNEEQVGNRFPGEATLYWLSWRLFGNMAGGSSLFPELPADHILPGTTFYNLSITVARRDDCIWLGCEALTSSNTNAGTLVITNICRNTIEKCNCEGVSRQSVVHQLDGGATNNTHTLTSTGLLLQPVREMLPCIMQVLPATMMEMNPGDYVSNGSLALTEGGGCNVRHNWVPFPAPWAYVLVQVHTLFSDCCFRRYIVCLDSAIRMVRFIYNELNHCNRERWIRNNFCCCKQCLWNQ